MSETGGICDCGDISVMKETGFCDRHKPRDTVKKASDGDGPVQVAEVIVSKILLRLIRHLRRSFEPGVTGWKENAVKMAESYLQVRIQNDYYLLDHLRCTI